MERFWRRLSFGALLPCMAGRRSVDCRIRIESSVVDNPAGRRERLQPRRRRLHQLYSIRAAPRGTRERTTLRDECRNPTFAPSTRALPRTECRFGHPMARLDHPDIGLTASEKARYGAARFPLRSEYLRLLLRTPSWCRAMGKQPFLPPVGKSRDREVWGWF